MKRPGVPYRSYTQPHENRSPLCLIVLRDNKGVSYYSQTVPKQRYGFWDSPNARPHL
jgi:hypothetical protein